jgi:hypothetical protein
MTLGFRGSGRRRSFVLARTALSHRSQMNGSHTVGLDEAQAGGEIAGPSLRCSNFRVVGWVTCHFSLLGRTEISFRSKL